jgi:hypothetical protein
VAEEYFSKRMLYDIEEGQVSMFRDEANFYLEEIQEIRSKEAARKAELDKRIAAASSEEDQLDIVLRSTLNDHEVFSYYLCSSLLPWLISRLDKKMTHYIALFEGMERKSNPNWDQISDLFREFTGTSIKKIGSYEEVNLFRILANKSKHSEEVVCDGKTSGVSDSILKKFGLTRNAKVNFFNIPFQMVIESICIFKNAIIKELQGHAK